MSTGWLPLATAWAGASCLARSTTLARWTVRVRDSDDAPESHRLRRISQGAATRYAASNEGRRLARRLAEALVNTTPLRWRAVQLLLIIAAVSLIFVLTGSLLLAISLGTCCVRVGERLMLWRLRHRRDRALLEAAPALSRQLAAELARGAGCGAALGAVAAGSLRREHAVLAPALSVAANHALLGRPAPAALADAMAEAVRSGGPGGRAIGEVVSLVALAQRSGSGGAPLLRLADVLDEDRRTGDHARAMTAEPRMAATVLPVLAVVALAMLSWGNPAILAAALSGSELLLLVGCAAVVFAGVMAVRRITTT